MEEGLRDAGDRQLAMRAVPPRRGDNRARQAGRGEEFGRAGLERQALLDPFGECGAVGGVDRRQVDTGEGVADQRFGGGIVLADETFEKGPLTGWPCAAKAASPVSSAMLSVSTSVPSRSKRSASYIMASSLAGAIADQRCSR
jgi:hypothetical protein